MSSLLSWSLVVLILNMQQESLMELPDLLTCRIFHSVLVRSEVFPAHTVRVNDFQCELHLSCLALVHSLPLIRWAAKHDRIRLPNTSEIWLSVCSVLSVGHWSFVSHFSFRFIIQNELVLMKPWQRPWSNNIALNSSSALHSKHVLTQVLWPRVLEHLKQKTYTIKTCWCVAALMKHLCPLKPDLLHLMLYTKASV